MSQKLFASLMLLALAPTTALADIIQTDLTRDIIDIKQAFAPLGRYTNTTTVGLGIDLYSSSAGPDVSFANEASFVAGTTVSASNGTQSFNIPYFNSPAQPTHFYTSIPFNNANTGVFTITATNSNFPTATFETRPINSLPAGFTPPPFITNVQTNNFSTTPTITWNQASLVSYPGYKQDVQIRIFDLDNHDQEIFFAKGLDATTTSYTIPATFSNGLSLQDNHHYAIDVETNVLTKGSVDSTNKTGSITRSFIPFNTNSSQTVNGPVFLPSISATGTGQQVYNFTVNVQQGQSYNIDPAVALGYVYKVGDGNPNFASVVLPDIHNSQPYQLLLWDSTTNSFVFKRNLPANVPFDFGLGGVSAFEILGIDPSLALDPNNATAFVTALTFTGDGVFTGTMTPITSAVPEPSTWAMMILGFCGLGFMAYRKKAALRFA